MAGEFRLPPVTRVTLENGLRLVVAEQREVPRVGTDGNVEFAQAQYLSRLNPGTETLQQLLVRHRDALEAEAERQGVTPRGRGDAA